MKTFSKFRAAFGALGLVLVAVGVTRCGPLVPSISKNAARTENLTAVPVQGRGEHRVVIVPVVKAIVYSPGPSYRADKNAREREERKIIEDLKLGEIAFVRSLSETELDAFKSQDPDADSVRIEIQADPDKEYDRITGIFVLNLTKKQKSQLAPNVEGFEMDFSPDPAEPGTFILSALETTDEQEAGLVEMRKHVRKVILVASKKKPIEVKAEVIE